MSSHTPRPFYTWARNQMRQFKALDDGIMSVVRRRRINRFRRHAEQLFVCAKQAHNVTQDFAYSIQKTDRGATQVTNLEHVIQYVTENNLPGAFVETGTHTGGASAFALKSFLRHDPGGNRPYWGFDSFEGMPAPTQEDGEHGAFWIYGKKMNDVASKKAGTLTGHDVNVADFDECKQYLAGTSYKPNLINLVKGWFQDTLAKHKAEVGTIAILRLDGDFYESTKVVLEELYDQVVSGGVVIVDDYGAFEGCRKAVNEFLVSRSKDPVHLVVVDRSIRYFIKP